MNNSSLNSLFMNIPKRAEGADSAVLVATFVDLGPLVNLLSTRDHQVIYGRRGTGKTHALRYLAESRIESGDVAVYVDMRTIGSSGGLYSDVSLPRSERGTRLLMDTLSALHDSLLQQVWQREADFDLSQLLPILDSVADAITEVRVEGVFEQIDLSANDYTNQCSESVGLGISEKGIALDVKASSSLSAGFKSSLSTSQKGVLRHRVHFGRLSKSLGNLSSALGGRRLWILLDEWSAIPKELQPILADLIRRSILPMNRFVVKIGAIEHRSTFQDIKIQGDYCGIELGADVSADLNLDDFMVFDNSAERAKHFFSQLIFRHSVSLAKEAGTPLDSKMTADELLAVAFTRRDVFEEYVRASEGVPRDAINILSLAARQAGDASISMEIVRAAARIWYERDKQAAVNSNQNARGLLFKVIDDVIGKKRARAFLLKSNSRVPLIDELFDMRVLHILKRNVSSKDEPGARYDVFKIDYGCYVDLLNTQRAPQGLLAMDYGDLPYTDVPPDDYRAIRRAILRVEDGEVASNHI